MANYKDDLKLLDKVAIGAMESGDCEGTQQGVGVRDSKLAGLGVRISQYTEWNGRAIMKIFVAALEDANYHRESGVVEGWLAGEPVVRGGAV